MHPKITAREGWVEIEIDDNCDYSKFELAANILKKQFNVRFTEKLDGVDDAYWDFVYKDCELTLHFNLYCGISIIPKNYGLATTEDNEGAKEIGTLLFERLNHSS
jgi:hypothetical protein